MITSILNWLYSFYHAFIEMLFGLAITDNGVSVGSVMIVCAIFLLVVSNLMLIAKRN